MLVADRMITGDGKTVIEEGAVVLENGRIRRPGRFRNFRRSSPGKRRSSLRAVR